MLKAGIVLARLAAFRSLLSVSLSLYHLPLVLSLASSFLLLSAKTRHTPLTSPFSSHLQSYNRNTQGVLLARPVHQFLCITVLPWYRFLGIRLSVSICVHSLLCIFMYFYFPVLNVLSSVLVRPERAGEILPSLHNGIPTPKTSLQ